MVNKVYRNLLSNNKFYKKVTTDSFTEKKEKWIMKKNLSRDMCKLTSSKYQYNGVISKIIWSYQYSYLSKLL